MVDVRNRLVKALHTSASLPQLREELVMVLCDLESYDNAAPTVRSVGLDQRTQTDASPDTEPDSAPPTPTDSELGQEYGV